MFLVNLTGLGMPFRISKRHLVEKKYFEVWKWIWVDFGGFFGSGGFGGLIIFYA